MLKTNTKKAEPRRMSAADPYAGIATIDGRHPYREAVPGGCVDYPARTRHGGRILYFNFDLAKEMGLIPNDHPDKLNKALTKTLLHTFSLQIINEYDQLHKTPIDPKDVRPHPYMATRYLQIQHPSNIGNTSGDGRSMWNGTFNANGITWDISSGGTGATRLSPATAIENRFFKTGEKNVSYGCGLAEMEEGLSAAVTSEIMHRNNIPTERSLVIIAFDDRTSINVRAGKNLLRPAHFFGHLKQGNYQRLKGAVDYYIDRQIDNGVYPSTLNTREKRYRHFLSSVTHDFARMAAVYESNYIFCWMDWDGDNILTNAGIIDYGSIRQLGLYHSEYRYDDVDKMSTTIAEQKRKAKYIVQTFAQLVDFVASGTKKNIHTFRHHPALQAFEAIFESTKNEMMLYNIGFDKKTIDRMLQQHSALEETTQFRKIFHYFEKAKARRGMYKVSDGITWDAIFCMRDILRELPKHYSQAIDELDANVFVDILKSNYASKRDIARYKKKKAHIKQFQKFYRALINTAARINGQTEQQCLHALIERSDLINRAERVTGDGLIHATEKLIKNEKKLDPHAFHELFYDFVNKQVLRPEFFALKPYPEHRATDAKSKKILSSMLKIVDACKEGI